MATGRNLRFSILSAVCGVAALFLAGSPAARADEYAAGVTVVGQPDEINIDATTTCKFPGGCYTATYTVANGSTTPTAYAYEYNTSTCAQISPGEWRNEGKSVPKHGTDAQHVVTVTPTSGSCAGHSFQAMQVFYTASATTTPVADRFAIYWTTADYKAGKCPTCAISDRLTIKILK